MTTGTMLKIAVSAAIAAGIWSCSNLLTDGGTGTGVGNGMVIGRIVGLADAPAANVRVQLVPVSYNPVRDPAIPIAQSATTDSAGRYRITPAQSGVFNVEAVHSADGTRALVQGVTVSTTDTVPVPDAAIRQPGTIRVSVPANVDAVNGYLYISGTTLYAWLADNNGSAVISQVPAGAVLSVRYAVNKSPAAPQTVRDGVSVQSGGTFVIPYWGWRYSKRLLLNTTASGAGVTGTVTDFPVLIRLTGANFSFSEAMSGGQDVRFVKSDGTPLSYEIERWDASARKAEIWVRADTVRGNDSAQFIEMHCGAPTSAASLSDGPAVFDTGSGFQAVWHLSGAGNAACSDATPNHFDGIPSAAAPTAAAGSIGIGQRFNGASNYFTIPNSASGKLDFPEVGAYSISAWVYTDTLDSGCHVIVGKSDQQYGLQLTNINRWEYVEVTSAPDFKGVSAGAQARAWTLLTSVRTGSREYLYVNGALADSITSLLKSPNARNTGRDVMIGRLSPADTTESRYFKGAIEEVRIESAAHSGDWIRLCFMNQKADDALVKFK